LPKFLSILGASYRYIEETQLRGKDMIGAKIVDLSGDFFILELNGRYYSTPYDNHNPISLRERSE